MPVNAPRPGLVHDRPRSILIRSRTILAEETLLAEPLVTIDVIARGVARRFGVRLSILRGPSRRASVVAVRHVAMYLARMFAGSSFAAIGTYFGGRDPATVRHACKTAAVRLNARPNPGGGCRSNPQPLS